MLVLEAICEQTGLDLETVEKVMAALLNTGIQFWMLGADDAIYFSQEDMLEANRLGCGVQVVARCVEFDRFLVQDGEIL